MYYALYTYSGEARRHPGEQLFVAGSGKTGDVVAATFPSAARSVAARVRRFFVIQSPKGLACTQPTPRQQVFHFGCDFVYVEEAQRRWTRRRWEKAVAVHPRYFEFAILFGVAPVVFAVFAHRFNYRGAMAPVLWIVAFALLVVVLRDPSFDRKVLWRLPVDARYIGIMLLRLLPLGAGILFIGHWLVPDRFFWMPRNRPGFFIILVFAYPVLSAVPQGIIWRVFLVHRYASLFGDELVLVIVGALAFALAHLAFWNVPAIVVTAIGGALFVSTYLRTGSMLLASIEHGVYGILAFSAGLGVFLFRA